MCLYSFCFCSMIEPKHERGSALARALFKPLPGTKSDKASSSTPSKSDVMDMYQNLGSKFANSLSLSPKIGEDLIENTIG